jgi:fructose-bisphosphate aldolase class II
MKFSTAAATFAVLVSGATAFTVAGTGSSAVSIQRDAVRTMTSTTQLSDKMAEELGTPCEDECAMESYPNMPPSVHPGVNTGQAMIDLLNHAKENGKSKRAVDAPQVSDAAADVVPWFIRRPTLAQY